MGACEDITMLIAKLVRSRALFSMKGLSYGGYMVEKLKEKFTLHRAHCGCGGMIIIVLFAAGISLEGPAKACQSASFSQTVLFGRRKGGSWRRTIRSVRHHAQSVNMTTCHPAVVPMVGTSAISSAEMRSHREHMSCSAFSPRQTACAYQNVQGIT